MVLAVGIPMHTGYSLNKFMLSGQLASLLLVGFNKETV